MLFKRKGTSQMINIMKLKMDHKGRITIPKYFRDFYKPEVTVGINSHLYDNQVVMEFTPKEDKDAT